MSVAKTFWIFLLITIATAGFFYTYSAIKMKKTYSFFKPLDVLNNFTKLPEMEVIADYGKKTIDKIGWKIKNQVNKSAASVVDSVSEKADDFKDNAFNFVKENMNSGIDAVGNLLGVDTTQIATTTNQNCE